MKRGVDWPVLLTSSLFLSLVGCIPAVGVSNRAGYPVRFVDEARPEVLWEVLAVPLMEDFIGVVGAEGPDEDHGLASYYLAPPSVHVAGAGLPMQYSAFAALTHFTHILNWPNGFGTRTHGHLIIARGYRMQYVSEGQIERSAPGRVIWVGTKGPAGEIRLVPSESAEAEADRVLRLLAGPRVRMGDLPAVTLCEDPTPDPRTPVRVRFSPGDRRRLAKFLRGDAERPASRPESSRDQLTDP